MSNKISSPILITGSKGFIGANLLRRLINLKYKKINIILRNKKDIWRIKDLLPKCEVTYLDLNNKKKLKEVISKIKPKTIFHLATYGAYSHQSEFIKIKKNIFDVTVNLLNECLKYNFETFINTGSNSEYGFKDKKMKETDLLEPNSFYSLFKSASTNYCELISSTHNKRIISIRPFHVYGPYEEKSRLIPTVINNIINNKKSNMVDPNISRDLIYIDDMIDLYLKITLNTKIKNGIFNAASGKQYKIIEIYTLINEILGKNINAHWNKMKNRKWDQKIWVADISKAKKTLSWKPKNSLKEGLKKTVSWHKSFYFN